MIRSFLRRKLSEISSHLEARDRLTAAKMLQRIYEEERRELEAHPGRYPSKFGGLWTDRDDFEELLATKKLDEATKQRLRQWRRDGFTVFEGAIPPSLLDPLNARMAEIEAEGGEDLKMTGPTFPQGIPLDTDWLVPGKSTRIVDIYARVPEALDVLMSDEVTDWLKLIFEEQPHLTQSLSFIYGSEQAIHQDTNFVVMNSPMKMAAVWIALEDVREGSGALVYLPGSHRWPDHLFGGRYKHWREDRDGPAGYAEWEAWLREQRETQGAKEQQFFAKKGDILFWHAGLAHGGSPTAEDRPTRRSLVAHYTTKNHHPYYPPHDRKTTKVRNGVWSAGHYHQG
ncbi:MAG: phytanoyl-CoA dioxygenase family protein [Parvularcula sp.]|jgi:hypothetical protein|nr:phytanoyl-CoA dioxygenase family protein [Parvularcula sp.]